MVGLSEKILLLDVDGVFTDGKLYHVKDGLGIKLAKRASIRIGVISELGIEEIHLGFMVGRVGFPTVVSYSLEEKYALYVTKAEGGDNA